MNQVTENLRFTLNQCYTSPDNTDNPIEVAIYSILSNNYGEDTEREIKNLITTSPFVISYQTTVNKISFLSAAIFAKRVGLVHWLLRNNAPLFTLDSCGHSPVSLSSLRPDKAISDLIGQHSKTHAAPVTCIDVMNGQAESHRQIILQLCQTQKELLAAKSTVLQVQLEKMRSLSSTTKPAKHLKMTNIKTYQGSLEIEKRNHEKTKRLLKRTQNKLTEVTESLETEKISLKTAISLLSKQKKERHNRANSEPIFAIDLTASDPETESAPPSSEPNSSSITFAAPTPPSQIGNGEDQNPYPINDINYPRDEERRIFSPSPIMPANDSVPFDLSRETNTPNRLFLNLSNPRFAGDRSDTPRTLSFGESEEISRNSESLRDSEWI